ncbi:helix-turn-helix domain-containing protein [Sabulibacter ruber]|uniref:helix-turn-helix domain-containing protein n=1 Tax=Sabulibacter ruber TaxID=2811901 RepID=UPI001F6066F7|nr:AraC family transcriptional regulator [Sabulibacter ruber]
MASTFNYLRYYFNLMVTKLQTLEEFYAERSLPKPAGLDRGIGHLNVFRIEEQNASNSLPVAFNRKDYFKVCLTKGRSRIHYADRSFEIKEYALLFANPLIPYNWEPLDPEQKGFSCIFSEGFFTNYGRLKEYPVFKPGGFPVYDLDSTEVSAISSIFRQMIEELDSDFEFKDDVLRNLVFQLIHSTLKMRPSESIIQEKQNASSRIASLFIELLEKQFPIEENDDQVRLRSASDFADQLAVHVNHLNRSVKEVMQRTTSELIMQRLFQEAKILLKHSAWNISQIAYTLGFESPTHFNTFFKKHAKLTPSQFRGI